MIVLPKPQESLKQLFSRSIVRDGLYIFVMLSVTKGCSQ